MTLRFGALLAKGLRRRRRSAIDSAARATSGASVQRSGRARAVSGACAERVAHKPSCYSRSTLRSRPAAIRFSTQAQHFEHVFETLQEFDVVGRWYARRPVCVCVCVCEMKPFLSFPVSLPPLSLSSSNVLLDGVSHSLHVALPR